LVQSQNPFHQPKTHSLWFDTRGFFKCVTHWRQVHNSQFILLRFRTKGDQVALIGRHWLRWSGAEGLMTVKEPSSTTDSQILAQSILQNWSILRGFHCEVFPFCFSSFLFVLVKRIKGIFCQLNDYAKAGLEWNANESTNAGTIVFLRLGGYPLYHTSLDKGLIFFHIDTGSVDL